MIEIDIHVTSASDEVDEETIRQGVQTLVGGTAVVRLTRRPTPAPSANVDSDVRSRFFGYVKQAMGGELTLSIVMFGTAAAFPAAIGECLVARSRDGDLVLPLDAQSVEVALPGTDKMQALIYVGRVLDALSRQFPHLKVRAGLATCEVGRHKSVADLENEARTRLMEAMTRTALYCADDNCGSM